MKTNLTALAVCLFLSLVLAASAAAQSEKAAEAPKAPAAMEETPGQPTSTLRRQPETLLEFAIAGGWIMIPLCAASVVCFAFLVERLIVLRRERVFPRRIAAQLQELVREKPFDRNRALAALGSGNSAAAAVLRAAIERLDWPREKIEKAVQTAADRKFFELREHLWIFAVLSTASPLLGLLGTVIGLVRAFREVAISGLGAGATLAPGIYEALVATVAGLAVAIPSLAIYYWLHAKVDHYVHEIDNLVVDVVDTQELSPVGVSGGVS